MTSTNTNTNQPTPKAITWGHLIPLCNKHVDPSLNCILILKDSPITIGRKDDNTFQLHSHQVSSHHCKIERSSDGISMIFTDTSRNGTWIDKKPIRERIGYQFRVTSANVPKSQLEQEYCLMQTLGSGGFASVKLCQHKISGMKFAVKSIDRQAWQHLQYNTKRTVSLLDEVNIMKDLRHKNIVAVHEHFEEENCIHIIMDYCMGGDMLEYIQKHGRYSDEKACALFQQLVDGLQYLHMRDIAHRDLKPDNILLVDEESTWLKISDFGISRQCNSSLCKTIIGTPLYQAPEVCGQQSGGGHGYDGKLCDFWSLGLILFIMVVAAPPASKPEMIRELIAHGKLNWYDVDVNPNAKQMVMDLMKINPKERITITEIRKHPWITQVEMGSDDGFSFGSSSVGSLLSKRKENVVDSERGAPDFKRRKTDGTDGSQKSHGGTSV